MTQHVSLDNDCFFLRLTVRISYWNDVAPTYLTWLARTLSFDCVIRQQSGKVSIDNCDN